MKRTYDYYTGKLLKESVQELPVNRNHRISRIKNRENRFSRSKLYESVGFEDVITNAKAVYKYPTMNKQINVQKFVESVSGAPAAIWEFKGNFCIKEIEKVLYSSGIDFCSVSSRALAGNVVDNFYERYNDEEYVIIDDFTHGTTKDVNDIIALVLNLVQSGVKVICIGKFEADKNNNYFFSDSATAARFDSYVYYSDRPDDEDIVDTYESVSDKFSKYRKLYEQDEEDSDDSADKGDDDSDNDSDNDSDEGNSSDDKDDETEDVPMTAIVLTVAKDDVDKCKEELVDAGISEDAISVMDDDDENGKIKIDADFALELKDYLKGKGIDLEEKIGGEIVDDSAASDEGDDSDDSKEGDGEEKSDDDIDFDSEFGDLFGDDQE